MRVEEFGFSDISRALDRSEEQITGDVEKVTSKTLLEIKKHAARIVRGHPHLSGLAPSFSYEVSATKSAVTGEVGAVVGKRQGSLDFLIENEHMTEEGTIQEAPVPHWRPAAEKQVPLWEKYLADAAEGVLDDRKAR